MKNLILIINFVFKSRIDYDSNKSSVFFISVIHIPLEQLVENGHFLPFFSVSALNWAYSWILLKNLVLQVEIGFFDENEKYFSKNFKKE